MTYARWLAKNAIAHAKITGKITVSGQRIQASDGGYIGTVTLTTDADLIRISKAAGSITGNSGGSDEAYYYVKSGDTIRILSDKSSFSVYMESIASSAEEAGFLVGIPSASIQKVLVPIEGTPYPLQSAVVTFELLYGTVFVTKQSMDVFAILPQSIQQQLFLERDPHGNVQVSLIESEKLFSALVRDNLAARKAAGTYNGKFSTQHHFLGYEGRCAFPSNFDADYCYSLGYNAFMLIQYGYTGYLSKVSNLSKPAEEWVAGGMPITKMMNMERRNGKDKPVIRKALVELDGKPFRFFAEHRAEWAVETCYTYPGAIQYFGPREVCDLTTRTLALEKA